MRINAIKARDFIAKRESFNAGNLKGVKGAWGYGYMPEAQKQLYSEDISASHERGDFDSFYTVISYGTPIAWFVDAVGWTVTTVKYSVTTSKHTSIVKRAIDSSRVQWGNSAPLFN